MMKNRHVLTTAFLLFATSTASLAFAQSAPRPSYNSAAGAAQTGGTNGNGSIYTADPNASSQPNYGSQGYQQGGTPNGPPYGGDAPLAVDDGAVKRSQQQMKGDYGTMTRQTGVPLGTVQDAWSHPSENLAPGQVSPGIVHFSYNHDAIMPIRLREFLITTIVFPPQEHITPKNVYIGEDQYIEAAVVRPNVIALRTKAKGLDSNVTIYGDSGNVYNFYTRAEGYNTKKLTDLLVYVDVAPSQFGWAAGSPSGGWFTGASQDHSQPAPQTVQPAQPKPAATPVSNPTPAVSGVVVPSDRMIFNMRMYEVHQGDRAIAPRAVYTDRVWTYFDWRDKALTGEQPAVFKLVDGVETIVNSRTAGPNGEILIAEGIGDFVLRAGDRVICVKQVTDAATKSQ